MNSKNQKNYGKRLNYDLWKLGQMEKRISNRKPQYLNNNLQESIVLKKK